MRFLSVCSGIEAVSVAWNPLGFEALAFSEIDKFPSAVLAHHYPTVPNLGDMTNFKEWPDYEPDILVGGTPCQSFSVAGLRKGLADPRGNLMLTYLAIADRYQPEWLVWENVPGVLSSGGGRDFGTFLGALGALGYGWAYRTLDAQYFGVPQRRRRVFVIGHLGDWRRAAAVLFERHSLQGNPAPSREKRKSIAPTISARTKGGGGLGTDFDCDGGLIHASLTGFGAFSDAPPTLRAQGGDQGGGSECLIHCADIAHATTTHQAKGGDPTTDNYVTHSLRAEGFDASEDGTGRGTPLVPIAFNWQDNHSFRASSSSSSSSSNPLRANQTEAVALAIRGRDGTPQAELGDDKANAILTPNGGRGGVGVGAIMNGMQVRRLTPIECSRLQGFPDDYLSQVTWRGKSPPPDGPMYKALGNSMAVPCMKWIGERIQLVDWLYEHN